MFTDKVGKRVCYFCQWLNANNVNKRHMKCRKSFVEGASNVSDSGLVRFQATVVRRMVDRFSRLVSPGQAFYGWQVDSESAPSGGSDHHGLLKHWSDSGDS